MLRSGKGPRPRFALAAGRYFLELRTAADFRIETIDEGKPEKWESLTASKEVVGEGDTVCITEAPEDGIQVRASRVDFAKKMAVVDKLCRKYRNALRELSK